MVDTRVVYLEPGAVRLESMELPDPGPNQVLVQTHRASVCGSERYFYRGISVRPEDEARSGSETVGAGRDNGGQGHAYPMGPLGHEGGGTIVEIGAGVREYVGGGIVAVDDRIGSLIYPTYTDFWVTDIAHVQPIPEGVSFEVGCLYEPLGCAAWAALHMGVRLGDRVAVNGVGFAGNIMLQGALRAGASEVIAVDVDQTKLEVARRLGAHYCIDASRDDAVAAVDELTAGEGVEVAVEAVGGSGEGIKQALGMAGHNAILALYGDNYAPVSEFCFHRFHEDGLEVRNLNAVHYTPLRSIEHMREAFVAVQRGVFDLDIVFEHSTTHGLADIAEVFAREAAAADRQSSLKTVIVP